MHDKNDTKCDNRKMLVTVTAVAKNETSTNDTSPYRVLLAADPTGADVDLEFGAGSFSGAVFLGSTVLSLGAMVIAMY